MARSGYGTTLSVVIPGMGGLMVPEVRDEIKSVELTFKVGVGYSTGLHWHEETYR